MRLKIKVILCILIIAILIAIGFFIVRATLTVVDGANINASEADPMFASTPEAVTRPPEPDAEITQPPHATLDDYSPDVESPVEKTAEELAEEASATDA